MYAAKLNVFVIQIPAIHNEYLSFLFSVKNMVLTLYCLNASPPARAAMMAIEALNIPDVKFENVNLLTYEQLKDEFVEV